MSVFFPSFFFHDFYLFPIEVSRSGEDALAYDRPSLPCFYELYATCQAHITREPNASFEHHAVSATGPVQTAAPLAVYDVLGRCPL